MKAHDQADHDQADPQDPVDPLDHEPSFQTEIRLVVNQAYAWVDRKQI